MSTYVQLPVGELAESPTNPRQMFAQMDELAASIEQHGILTPLLVRIRGPKNFEIVAGARRYRAAKKLKLKTLPCIKRNMADADVVEIQVIENVQRADVHPMDEAAGYQQLVAKLGWDADEIARRVAKSPKYVHQRLALNSLIKPFREAMWNGRITLAHATLLAPLEQAEQRDILGHWFRSDGKKPIGENAAPTAAHLRRWLKDSFDLKLRNAPFSRTDAKLVPKAGACRTCPKRTKASPLLFEDLEVKGDRCLDRECWQGKTMAHVTKALAAARAVGKPLVEVSGPSSQVTEFYVCRAGDESDVCEHAEQGVIANPLDSDYGRGAQVCRAKECKKHAWFHGSGKKTAAAVSGGQRPLTADEIKGKDRERRERAKTKKQKELSLALIGEAVGHIAIGNLRGEPLKRALDLVVNALFARLEHSAKQRFLKRCEIEVIKKKGEFSGTFLDLEKPFEMFYASLTDSAVRWSVAVELAAWNTIAHSFSQDGAIKQVEKIAGDLGVDVAAVKEGLAAVESARAARQKAAKKTAKKKRAPKKTAVK